MQYGYARVSTRGQNLASQLDGLKLKGCRKIVSEKISAVKERPALDGLLVRLRAGDKLIVTKMDRLARSVSDLIKIAVRIQAAGADLVILDQQIDTSTPQGRLMFNIMSALGEFERELIQQRTCEGLKAARARGRVGGRPVTYNKKDKLAVLTDYDAGMTVSKVLAKHRIAKATLYKFKTQRESGSL